MKHATFTSVIVLATALTTACSSSKSSDDDNNEETTTVVSSSGTGDDSSSFFPTIDFSMPSSLSLTGLSLGETNVTILELQAQRGEKVVDDLNLVLERLNHDAVDGVGSFSGKGPEGTISGHVEELTDDADGYDHEAVICHNDVVFMHIKWTGEGEAIEAVRDFSADPMATENTASMLSYVKFSKGDDGDSLVLRSTGTPWKQPPFETDGDMMTEYAAAKIGTDGDFTLQAILDRYAEVPEAYEADEYIVGYLDAAQAGKFVAYNKSATDLCSAGFDEENTENPGFCVGQEVDSDTPFAEEEVATAWGELADIGYLKLEDLHTVEIDSELTCQ